MRVSMPWRASSRWVSRVSSAAISGTLRSVSSARSVTSPRLPIGVATTYSVPPAPAPSSANSAGGPLRVTDPWSRSCRSGPAARIQVIHSGGPWPELGDRRHLALEFRARDHPVHALDRGRLEAERGHLFERPSLVDAPEQEPIEDGVAEAALGLIGLARPQIGRRRLAHDRIGHSHR